MLALVLVINMSCDCHIQVNTVICPAGNVITGDLNVIRAAKLRFLIEKGPTYREQNYIIDWRVTERLCREAVAKYKCKWSRKEKVDERILDKLDHKVNECVRRCIASLRKKYINRGKCISLKRSDI